MRAILDELVQAGLRVMPVAMPSIVGGSLAQPHARFAPTERLPEEQLSGRAHI